MTKILSGHATLSDEIILEDDEGRSKQVPIPQLLNMFSAFRSSIRMVVLNACYSSAGLEKSLQSIDYVVGTDAALGDKAAIAFAGAFYQALAFGYPVQAAFELGKCQIQLHGLSSSEVFNLHIREGVDASKPFTGSRSKIKHLPTMSQKPCGAQITSKKDRVPILKEGSEKLIDPSIVPESPSHSEGQYSYGTLAIRSSLDVPVEIQDSLRRFQADYPDPAKVAFLMMRFGRTGIHDQIVAGIRKALDPLGIAVVRADDKQYHDDLFPNVLTYIYGSSFGIAVFERLETEEFNPNVALEVGYVFALKKHICLLKDRTVKTLHADLVGKLYRVFDPQDPIGTIPPELSQWLTDKGLNQFS